MVITYKEIKNQKIETEERYKRESEILGKVVSEILLKYSDKVDRDWKRERTDEQITEILNQPDWRKKTDFAALWDKDKSEAYLGHRWSIPWIVSAREPIEIIERLNEERNEWISESIKLEKKVKELEKSNLWLQKELKEAWSEGDTHIEAMRYMGELAKEEINNHETKVKDLKEEVRGNKEVIQKSRLTIGNQENEIQQLKEELQDSLGLLAKTRKTIQTQETLLHLADKPLPPLPKKQNRFKQVGTKIKTKLQQLVKKVKTQTREMVAQIEIRTK